jgi:hypothetical protein
MTNPSGCTKMNHRGITPSHDPDWPLTISVSDSELPIRSTLARARPYESS